MQVQLTGISTHYSPKSLMDAKWWSDGTRGLSSSDPNALGSVINLYDNKLILPVEAKRKVLVRHLNIGDNRVISASIIDPNKTFTGNSTATLTDANGNTNDETVTSNRVPFPEFQEVYASENNSVPTENGVKIGILKMVDYECVGYNRDWNVNFNVARSSRNNKITTGSFEYAGNATTVFVPPNSTKTDDYVLVDIYYRQRNKLPRTVLVRHIDIATNTTISTQIVSEAGYIPEAGSPTRTLSPTNSVINSRKDLYPEFQEAWVITGNEGITIKAGTPYPGVAPAESSNISDIYTYRGYVEATNTNSSYENAFDNSLAERERKIATRIYSSTTTYKTLGQRTGDAQYENVVDMIDFYYSSNPPVLKLQLKPLVGTIKYDQALGSPFAVTSSNKAVVPSDENIKLGNVGAYKYMLGGIQVKENVIAEDKTYNITHYVTKTGKFKYREYITQKEFSYTGDYQTFTLSEYETKPGWYKIELWGASGNGEDPNSSTLRSRGGKGGYVSAEVYIDTGNQLRIYIGGQGSRPAGGYNGGGNGGNSGGHLGGGGGGATDIRILKDGSWQKLLVAGGGGGSDDVDGTSGPENDGSGGNGGRTCWPKWIC